MNSLIFDAHLDLSMNAMEWNRDIRLPLVELRRRELGMTDKPDRTRNTVCLPEIRPHGLVRRHADCALLGPVQQAARLEQP